MKAKIGIFGFGTVGQGFYDILSGMNGTAPGQIVRICVRDRFKTRPLPPENFIFEPSEILDDPEITHIVEVIDRPLRLRQNRCTFLKPCGCTAAARMPVCSGNSLLKKYSGRKYGKVAFRLKRN
ncbi:MAG: hypothetical protein R3D58_00010 [Saprospiraceae bacterium]